MKQQTIWIWGDSWGVPNYAMPEPWYTARYHTSELLSGLGHSVTNFAQNGRSNLAAIEQSQSIIPHLKEKVDWILWFHTAIFRDCDHVGSRKHSYSAAFHDTAELVYNSAMSVVNDTGARLIFVEGHAPVDEPVFSEIVRPFHKIMNWRGQILGDSSLPQSHWYCQSQDLMDDPLLTTEQKHTEVSKLEIMQDALCASALFVDNSHPGDYAHIQLTAEILQVINTSLGRRQVG